MLEFIKKFFIYGLASILGKMIAVFLMPIYTDIFSVEEYGVMAVIMGCKGIIDLISNLNIHSGVARDYYEVGKDKYKLISTGFWSVICCSFVVLIVLIAARGIFVNNILEIEGYSVVYIVMLFTIPSGSLFSFFAIITRFKDKPSLYAAGSLFQLIIQVIVSITLVVIFEVGIIGVFIGLLTSEIFGAVFFWFVNRCEIRLFFNKQLLKRILLYSLPTLPAILGEWIDSSLGQILINKFISSQDAGVYSVALRIVSVFMLFNVAFNNVWGPHLFRIIQTNNYKEEIDRIFKLIVVLLLLLSLNLIFFSEYIITILANDEYLRASRYISILCIPMSFMIFSTFARIGPQVTRRTYYISIATIVGSAINILGILLFIDKVGIIVVPLALAFSKISSFTLSWFYTKKEIQYCLPLNYVFLYVVVVGTYMLSKFYLAHKEYAFIILLVLNVSLTIKVLSDFKIKNIKKLYAKKYINRNLP